MKALLLLLVPGLSLAEESKILPLEYKSGDTVDYPAQIQAKFKQLLDSDSNLAKEFQRFESPPPKGARGRYSGEPTIQVLTLSKSEHADFRDTGGTKKFEIALVLYYRFEESEHRGSQTSSGFFARFTVTGNLSYRQLDNDELELANSHVVAKFQGFSRNLAAPRPEEDQQAEQDAALKVQE